MIDLGMRGRAITDPVRDAKRFCDFTIQAASALMPLGRLDESMELYLELRRRYTLPKIHMTTSKAALGDVAGALADFSFVLDIVISRVLRLGMLPVERPLIFYQGGYGRFEAAESAALR